MFVIDSVTTAVSHLNWGSGWGLGVLCMLILRLTQINRPGTTGHNYKITLDKHYDGHPMLRQAPRAWRTVSWFMMVLRDMILWPIFFLIEIHRTAVTWRVRIQRRRAGKSWQNPRMRQLSRHLLRRPANYEQLCAEAGVPRLASAIALTIAHPERVPDCDTYVPDSDSPLAKVPELTTGLQADPWEYPYLTGGYLRFREELELWPYHADRIAGMLTAMRKRTLNKTPWACSEILAHYAMGLAKGWLRSDHYDAVVGFLANLVDGDQALRQATLVELMEEIRVVPADMFIREMDKAKTWPEQFRLYDKFGEIAEPTTPHLPVTTDTGEQVAERL